MGYPDFVCMGFQKCGTTTLYQLLKQHPQVALCRDVKEPMYYRVPLWSIMGRRFYRWRYFGHIEEGETRLLGEVNAGLTYGGCARKIKRDFDPDTKMIFMMRNPVDRSYSAYRYFLARGFLPASVFHYDKAHGHAEGFDHYVRSILQDDRKRSQIMKKRMKYIVLSQSNYAACIGEYLDTFDLHNMKFVIFEEFVHDEHTACRDIYDFLGIGDVQDIDYHVKSNEGAECAVSWLRAKQFWLAKGTNYCLYDLCYAMRWMPGFYRKFRRYYRDVREKTLLRDMDKSKVLPRTRDYLMAYFDADIRKLESLTGRNLRDIWNC